MYQVITICNCGVIWWIIEKLLSLVQLTRGSFHPGLPYRAGDYAGDNHSGSTGINSTSIIIGGHIFPVDFYNDSQTAFHIMLEPRSLQQLAMQTICTHHSSLPWNCLPKKLSKLLGISTGEAIKKFQQLSIG